MFFSTPKWWNLFHALLSLFPRICLSFFVLVVACRSVLCRRSRYRCPRCSTLGETPTAPGSCWGDRRRCPKRDCSRPPSKPSRRAGGRRTRSGRRTSSTLISECVAYIGGGVTYLVYECEYLFWMVVGVLADRQVLCILNVGTCFGLWWGVFADRGVLCILNVGACFG